MTDISVIIPIYNGERWINTCMKSIATQTVFSDNLNVEIVTFNDGSNDNTEKLLKYWAKFFNKRRITFITTGSPTSKGVGAAKNGGVRKSTGEFLCFQDIDDLMHSDRLRLQWMAAKTNLNSIVGSKIKRDPIDSTPRLVRWTNSLTPSQLKLQIYTSNGPTLLMPTWFCHRSVYDKVGGFIETGSGTPEDLMFFYTHLDLGGALYRVDEELIIYRFHENATTFSIPRETIWKIQLDRLQKCVLPYWNNVTIWNAGKAGRKVVRSLNPNNLSKVVAFCDVDKKKINKTIELYCPVKRTVIIKLPVLHFKNAIPPLLICVKLDLTSGQFEENLKSLNLIEGKDYILFS